jgi:hypothetical protein
LRTARRMKNLVNFGTFILNLFLMIYLNKHKTLWNYSNFCQAVLPAILSNRKIMTPVIGTRRFRAAEVFALCVLRT